jgi:hypothetical protein
VPMGITSVTVFGRNDIDQVLTDLRDAVREAEAEGPGGPGAGAHAARIDLLAGRVRRIVHDLGRQAEVTAAVADPELQERTVEAVSRASSDAFWEAFRDDPLPQLDWLDARVAPLAADGRLLYLRAIGTDPGLFGEVFDRFHVVLGQPIPQGKPGFLFSHRTYERLVKMPVAATLDRLRDAVVVDGDSIDADPLLRDLAARNARQYRRITYQLDVGEAEALQGWLREQLAGQLPPDADLDALVQAWLTVDDANVEARVAGFYERMAPLLQLYEVPVGSTITLRGFTKSGFLEAVEVPVYGTYEFTGLEEAGLQSAANLIDLVTFRELYGKMSDQARDELASIRDSVGVADVSREDAEAALFGGAPIEAEAAVGDIDVDIAAVETVDPWARQYPVEELERGLVLSAAVVLGEGASVSQVTERVEAAAEPLGLQVVDWKGASGAIGQFVTVIRVVLLVALAIIFLVALIIVNNAMVMATLDRVPEIGTLRAIGAQRATVLGLFLTETALLGLLAGGAGAVAAVVSIVVLGRVGIPADYEVLVLMFGGPRLYPEVGLDDVAFGLLAITSVAVGSTLYPALMAARVPPIVAMQGRD